MRTTGSATVLGVAILAAGLSFSGGTAVDPPVPQGFPGVVPAFLARAEKGKWGEWGHRREDEAAAPRARRAAHRSAIWRDRRWLARATPLGKAAPGWARRMYRRSLLVLRAVVDRDSGATVAGAPAGWAYVWPRDAAAVAIALASAGQRQEARGIVRFLLGLELDAAARFDRDGEPIEGRAAQGDAAGWVAAAAREAGIRAVGAEGVAPRLRRDAWRGRADYQEKDGGDYLGNAIAATGADEAEARPHRYKAGRRPETSWIERAFGRARGLVRAADEPDSGIDSAAAWAVRPFPIPALFPTVRRTLLTLVAARESRFGLVPSEGWDGGEDPWTAPTAWTAWALAALASEERKGAARNGRALRDRRAALALMAALRRAATPLGLLPERVDAQTGLPASTTPLAWSHAFAVLAIRELWP